MHTAYCPWKWVAAHSASHENWFYMKKCAIPLFKLILLLMQLTQVWDCYKEVDHYYDLHKLKLKLVISFFLIVFYNGWWMQDRSCIWRMFGSHISFKKKEIDGVNGQNICWSFFFFCILFLPLFICKACSWKMQLWFFKSNVDISRWR